MKVRTAKKIPFEDDRASGVEIPKKSCLVCPVGMRWCDHLRVPQVKSHLDFVYGFVRNIERISVSVLSEYFFLVFTTLEKISNK